MNCAEYLAVPVEGDEPVSHFMQHRPARKLAWIEVNHPIPSPVRASPMNVRGCINRKGGGPNFGPVRSVERFKREGIQFRAQQWRPVGISRPPVSDEELHCRLFRGMNRCRIGLNVY